MDEVDTVRSSLGGIALGLRMPDLLDLQQTPVTCAHVVLAELQRGSPPCSFELATIGLLQGRAVLAQSHQALTWRGKGSGDHGAILNDRPCGTSVPIACEFPDDSWGQVPKSVCSL